MSSPFSAHTPLPPGYTLDVYEFERVLGNPGSFGVTYAARDKNTSGRVAIKELFPSDFVVRNRKGRVLVQTAADEDIFREAMRMFRQEANILSQVKHENVVRVIDYLEANGTAYMVMEYEDGYDLNEHLEMQKPQRPNENELRKLLLPLLDGLEAVHNLNYLHRDIKPSNLYLTRKHRLLLLDFGAARQVVVSRSRPLTEILTAPFGPIEQYGQTLAQGPFTDIYAIGVVLFSAMQSGVKFPAAPDRLRKDTFVPLQQALRGSEYSQGFLAAVDWALQVRGQDRPQNIAAWRPALNATQPRKPVKEGSNFFERLDSLRKRDSRSFWRLVIMVGVVLLGAIAIAVVLTYLLSSAT
jgi:serine/threonine protein kinase